MRVVLHDCSASRRDCFKSYSRRPAQFKVSREGLVTAHRSIEWARTNILIAVAGGADGTSGVREAADATMREEMEKASHAIFASSLKQRDFWLGRGKMPLEALRERYGGPKPCLWGCDAHELARVAKPDEDRFCWIKGVPVFDTLRQAYIDPERAYVAPEPPTYVAASQIIDSVTIDGAPWVTTPVVKLNPGLVAIIGARGSGKTALADIIAAGCNAYEGSDERPSFLARAHEHLSGATVRLKWLSSDDGPVERELEYPVKDDWDAYTRALYARAIALMSASSIPARWAVQLGWPGGVMTIFRDPRCRVDIGTRTVNVDGRPVAG